MNPSNWQNLKALKLDTILKHIQDNMSFNEEISMSLEPSNVSVERGGGDIL